jgi:copper homeostasis protein
VANATQSMEDIIDIGFERILTSGLQPGAEAGIPMLTDLVKQAAGRIIVMPGAGVRSTNLEKIAKETKATEFHSSAGIPKKSGMEFVNHCMKEDRLSAATDAGEIKKMSEMIKTLEQESLLSST